MNGCELLDHILDDLRKVETVRRESNSEKIPEVGLRYLAANHEALSALVGLVYSDLDNATRRALYEKHKELHSTAANDGFRDLALHTIQVALEWTTARHDDIRALWVLKEDDLEVFVRVIRYAKYTHCNSLNFELCLSPIEDYGLNRPAGNFEKSLTEAELKGVPWHLSDVVYAEWKTKIFDHCRGHGFHFDNPRMGLRSNNFREDLKACIDLIVDLLKCKAECIVAVILMQEVPRERFLNSVVRRVDSEASSLIGEFRRTLLSFGPQPPGELQQRNVDHDLEPLRVIADKLLAEIHELQPRLAIFREISDLNNNSKKGKHIMGDNYEAHGPVGIMGPQGIVQHATVVQNQIGSDIDLKKLSEELSLLRAKMQTQAGHTASAEQQAEIGHVASAEIEAKKGNRPGVINFLKKAGKWTFDAATEIGAGLAVELIKKSSGM